MNKKLLLILPALLFLAASCNGKVDNSGAKPTPTPTPVVIQTTPTPTPTGPNDPLGFNKVKVTLAVQNNSGESGTATIFEVNGKVNVVLNVTGVPLKAGQPAHIHFGSCAKLGDVNYTLANAVTGTSQTILSITLAEFIKQPFAINVHKSVPEIGVYVACGDSTKMVKSVSTDPAIRD